ncbi:MAG TPA: hypothetical protein VGN98_02020 [Tianweitania sediminis]|jgi:hypothetical protein|nr:hypothetical protein [Tianweitania sediminis]
MGKPIRYAQEELAWIKANCSRPRAEAHAEFVSIFGRDDVVFANYVSLCKRNGWLTGRTGRFDKGNVPWSAGKQMPYNPQFGCPPVQEGQPAGEFEAGRA